jgi:hypothetical protein
MNLALTGNYIRFSNVTYVTGGVPSPVSGSVGATVTASLTNVDGTAVPNATAIPMSIVSGTVADWYCITPSTVVLAALNLYFVEIDVAIAGITIPAAKARFRAEQPTGSATPT